MRAPETQRIAKGKLRKPRQRSARGLLTEPAQAPELARRAPSPDMMNRGDLDELATILGHSNLKMTGAARNWRRNGTFQDGYPGMRTMV